MLPRFADHEPVPVAIEGARRFVRLIIAYAGRVQCVRNGGIRNIQFLRSTPIMTSALFQRIASKAKPIPWLPEVQALEVGISRPVTAKYSPIFTAAVWLIILM